MKRNFLLLIAMCLLCTFAFGQDIHGVDGYYNYTPTQMKASGMFTTTNGTSNPNWKPVITYTDDMKYLKCYMGINNPTPDETGFDRRTGISFSEKNAGEGCMTITRKYPILAFKVSIPHNNYSKVAGYWEPEFLWWNPSTGVREKLPLNGLDNNGRYRFLTIHPYMKDQYGRDSVQLNKGNNGYEVWRSVKVLHTYKDSIWYIRRLEPKDGEMTDFVVALNFGLVTNNVEDGAVLDTTDIKLQHINSGFNNVRCDTLTRDTLESGEIVTRTLTREEQSLFYYKWIKTFKSFDEFFSVMNEEGNWGDGPEVDPNKDMLNSELYATRLLIANYKFSDKLEPLQVAFNAALQVYDNPASTSDEFLAAVEALKKAKEDFLIAIALISDAKMVNFYNLSGMPLGLSAEDVTAGNFTGKQLEFSSAEPQNFLLLPNGTSSGQNVYMLKTTDRTMVQASNGQLLFVPTNELTSPSIIAQLVLGNRGTEDSPGYDFKVGKYYYFFNENTGLLEYGTEIPTVETYDEITSYLFFPMDAPEYDPADHDDINYPMISGEGSFSEFNEPAQKVLDYAFEYSFATFPWDADAKAVATEHATMPMMDGWRTNGYRLNTNIQQATIDDATLMRLNKLDEYYSFHKDTLCQTIATTDYVEDGIYTIMREHGAYTSASNVAPQPNQLCDSLFAINLNSGINRYLAIKWKGTDEGITMNEMVLFIKKSIGGPTLNMGNLLEKRGDVYVWDLLACGVPYGDSKACAQYLSWHGVKNSSQAVYVDWIRFYNNLDEIPSETINVPMGKKGDANEDGTVDVSDITTIAAYILGQNPSPFNAGNADVNSDNSIDVSDITATAGMILGTN